MFAYSQFLFEVPFSMYKFCFLFILMLITAVPTVRAEYTPEQKAALAELRSSLAGRQLPDIAPQLAKLTAIQGDEKFQAEAARLELLAKYVQGFWDAVDKGAKAALNT